MRFARTIRPLVACLVAATWLAGASVCSAALPQGQAQGKDQAQPKVVEKVKDPVCGMNIDPAKAKGKSEYDGKTYYFCSDDCKTKFDKDPAKYVPKPAEKK